MNIEIVGLNQLIQDINTAGINARPLVNAALQNSATIVQRNVREGTPIKTGSLKRSILTTVSYPNATVTANEKYASMVEGGTKPHLITPKNKKALFWKGAYSPYKVIKHPGTKANPFFSTGVEKSQQAIQDQFDKVVERLIKIMAGK